jgi:hypothetical protein
MRSRLPPISLFIAMTNSMQKSLFGKTKSLIYSRNSPPFMNSKVNYHVHNSPQLGSIRRKMYTVPINTHHFFKIHFNIILPSTPRSLEWSLPFTFSDQNVVCISFLPYVIFCKKQNYFYNGELLGPGQPSNLRTTSCRLPATAYFIGLSGILNLFQTWGHILACLSTGLSPQDYKRKQCTENFMAVH